MTEIVDKLKEQRGRDARRGWWMGIGLVVLMLGAVAFLWSRDSDAPDDAGMQPVFTGGGGKDNELLKFVKELKALPEPKIYSGLSREAQKHKWGAEQEMAEFLNKNDAVVQAWERFAMTDSSQWRWRLQDHMSPAAEMYGMQLASVYTAARLMRMKSLLLARKGNIKDAVKVAFDLRAVGLGMKHAEGSMLHFIIASAIEKTGLSALEDVLALSVTDEEQIGELQQKLGEEDLATETRRSLRTAYQIEYQLLKKGETSIQETMDVGLDPSPPKILSVVAYKKNRTLRAYLHYQQPVMEALSKGNTELWSAMEDQMEQLNVALDRPWWRSLSPNLYGDRFVASLLRSFGDLSDEQSMTQNTTKMLQVILAMRRFELANGHTAPSLSELVPAYLDKVPLDAYHGDSLRWVSKQQLVYVPIGDSRAGGGVKRKPRKKDDTSIHTKAYFWGEAAKARYQADYGIRGD